MIIEGINVINEYLSSGKEIEKIFVEKTDNKDILKIMDRANARFIPIQYATKQELEKMVNGKTQGVVAFVENFKYCEIDDILLEAKRKNKPPFIVILDGIEDPQNVGAIIRTCECAGVDGVVIAKNRACEINKTVFKTSAGAVAFMKVAMVTNLTRTIEYLKEQGVWTYALEAGNKRVYDADFTYPTAIVVGSEGFGVSRLVKERVDEILSLNMYGEVNSLNASNAAAIGIYEVVRQRS